MLYSVLLVVSLLGRVLASGIEPVGIHHGCFPAEIMIRLCDFEDPSPEDTLALALTCKAFYQALISSYANEAFWKIIEKSTESESFDMRIMHLRFLGLSDFVKKKFEKMELDTLFALTRHLSFGNKDKRQDNLTDYIADLLLERMSARGNINIRLPDRGPEGRSCDNKYVKESLVLRVFENSHVLPSLSWRPSRFSVARAKMMYHLMGWRFVWKFLDSIPALAFNLVGVLACIAIMFPLQPTEMNPFYIIPACILFFMSLIKQGFRILRSMRGSF